MFDIIERFTMIKTPLFFLLQFAIFDMMVTMLSNNDAYRCFVCKITISKAPLFLLQFRYCTVVKRSLMITNKGILFVNRTMTPVRIVHCYYYYYFSRYISNKPNYLTYKYNILFFFSYRDLLYSH